MRKNWRWNILAKLIACRDYSSKDKGKNIVGYKINLTKKGVDSTGIDYKKDELQIEYGKEEIRITKK